MTEPFSFDLGWLEALAIKLREAYKAARPFPHVVIDDFLPVQVLECVLREFPTPGQIDWWTFDDARERKLGTFEDTVLGPVTRQVFSQFNSAPALDFLGKLTGIDGLVPDPHFNGGGLHQIEPGGFLKVHVDFNLHPTTRLERQLNLLLYLNKDWQPEYGGELQLWNADMTLCEQSIEPVFNRCVIFTTSDQSYHGHPDPLKCPPGMTRKSIALYYYTAPRDTWSSPAKHNTEFRARPGEQLPVPSAHSVSRLAGLRRTAKRWLPPALADGLRRHREHRQRGVG